MPNTRLQYLFDSYLRGNCTPDEKRELAALALSKNGEPELRELVDSYWQKVAADRVLSEEKAAEIYSSILASDARPAPVRRISTLRRLWWAAAAVLLILGSYYIFFQPDKEESPVVQAPVAGDVEAPRTNRATITLADGSTVYLDSAGNGQLAMQGNVSLVKLANGQISYTTIGAISSSENSLNTLSNPRGSQVIDMRLADGSHVWLNAGSSITYPVAFSGNERTVQVTGEAYFEVAHNPTRPFRVSKNNMMVEVLGTHFNINAYDDENDIKVTLLEGSVNVRQQQQQLRLKPGQQAIVENNIIALQPQADVDAVMAWKNGLFAFQNTSTEVLLRQLARWYNLEVEYRGNIPQQFFTGKIGRDLSLMEVLNGLQQTRLKLKLEDNKLIVMP